MGNSNNQKPEKTVTEEELKKLVFKIPTGTAGSNIPEDEKDTYQMVIEGQNITNETFEKVVYGVIENDERKITRVMMKNNKLASIPKVPKSVVFFDVRHNDLSKYPEDYNIREIDVSENKFKSFSDFPQSSAKHLKLFRCGSNPFQEPHFKDLERFEKLEKLFMYEIYTLHNLNGFPLIEGITNLDFDNCRLKSFKGLPSLPNLQWLLARENGLEDLELPKLPSLKYLLIHGNKIKKVELNDVPCIEWLVISHNLLADTSGIESLASLKQLNLDDNKQIQPESLLNLLDLNLTKLSLNGLPKDEGVKSKLEEKISSLYWS